MAAAAPLLPGRITVEHRVLVKVAEHAAVLAVDVPPRSVKVAVTESRSELFVRIHTPLPIPPLDHSDEIQEGPPILERVAALQRRLRDEIGRITGRKVSRVSVTITGAIFTAARRVR